MALRHWDGFTAYNELADLDHLYVREGSTTNIAIVPNGGPQELGGVRLGGSNLLSAGFYRTITSSTTVILGFWYRWDSFDTSAGDLYDRIMYLGASATEVISLRQYSDGSLRVYRSGSTLLFDSAVASYSPDGLTTNYIVPEDENRVEIRVFSSATVGTLEVRVNGKVWTAQVNINTGGSSITRIYFQTGSTGAGAEYEISEVYAFDDTGTFNNSFLYPWRAVLFRPTSDDSVAFTRNTGAANYETVDDEPHDADGSHNASTANGQVDRFASTGTISGLTSKIAAANVVSIARRESASQNIRSKIRHGGIDGNGSSFALPSAEDYRPVIQSFETNPSTSAQWTVTEIQDATFGYESMA
jgi:hypothetical protein